jgi:hypothetical protein
MGLDIRLPIGLMFSILGLLLTGFGLFGDKTIYQKALGININLWWGLVMLAEETPEGQEIETIEHESGLEQEPYDRG